MEFPFDVNAVRHQLYITSPFCKVLNSVTQAIPTAAFTNMLFDTDVEDKWGMHSTVANTDRITITIPGWYWVGAQCSFTANATGARQIQLVDTATTEIGRDILGAGVTGLATYLNLTGYVHHFKTGDYVTCGVYQASGADLDLQANTSMMWARYIHGLDDKTSAGA